MDKNRQIIVFNKHKEVTRLKMDFGSKAILREVEAQDRSQANSLRFVVDEMVMGQVYVRVLRVSLSM